MNRRGFLKFLTVAPVAAPMAAAATTHAAAMPAVSAGWRVTPGMNLGNIDWSRWEGLFGKPLTQWERDTRAFNIGVNNIKATVSYAEKLPTIVSTVIEKTADLTIDHLTRMTEQPALPAKSESHSVHDGSAA